MLEFHEVKIIKTIMRQLQSKSRTKIYNYEV